MKYKITELIDLKKIQVVIENFCKASGIASAIIDLDGKIIIHSKWQKICTDFFRVNPQTLSKCIESDTMLANKLLEGQKYVIYKCRNGLVDAAVPIVIGGEHLANFFIGQILFNPPDIDFFQKQAQKYGFDQASYLKALSEVPVLSEDRFRSMLDFISGFVELLGEMGLQQIRQSEATVALKESEEKLSQIVEGSSTPVFVIDKNHTVTHWNKACENLTGVSAKKITGTKKHWTAFYSTERPLLADLILNNPTEEEIDKYYFNKSQKSNLINGAYEAEDFFPCFGDKWLFFTAAPLRDNQGNVVGAIETLRDITERKQAEDMLSSSETLYRSTIDSMDEHINVIDPDFRILLFNAPITRWCKELGINSDDIIGRSLFEALPFLDEKKIRDECTQVLETQKPVITQETTKFGEKEIITETRKIPVIKNRKVTQIVTIITDITERKLAEEKLSESEKQYKHLFSMVRLMCDNLPDLIWTKDLENKFIFANIACCEKLLNAKDIDEPIGKTDIFFAEREKKSHPDNPDYHTFGETCSGSDSVVLKTKKAHRSDESGNIKGKFVFLDVYKAPFKDEKGNLIGTVGCARDVTKERKLEKDRKQAEEELKIHREHLEELVKERTKRIEDSQQALSYLIEDANEARTELDVINSKLNTANKELESFSYSVSHDLRAPLRSIDGFSKILLEDYHDVLEKQGKHYLQRVRFGTQKMGQLIDDLLNLSRIGRQPLNKKTTNLKTIANEVYQLLEPERKNRKVKFTVHDCPETLADPNLMQNVFLNLLSNALKFTKNKPITEIEFGYIEKDNKAIFIIKDNGVGFDMKFANKLFSPFQRLHSNEEFEGSGIGLAIVQRIINKHGGKIWVESEP
ncbi:MAG: PocR ligand-binding domain-containing protein, partial [Bacteroidales bacterium]|nr:PocR ligand-binding domain-containing protein [Bacteroidales bacterium]